MYLWFLHDSFQVCLQVHMLTSCVIKWRWTLQTSRGLEGEGAASAGTCCVILTFVSPSTVALLYIWTSHYLFLKWIKGTLKFVETANSPACLPVPVTGLVSDPSERRILLLSASESEQSWFPTQAFSRKREVSLMSRICIPGQGFMKLTSMGIKLRVWQSLQSGSWVTHQLVLCHMLSVCQQSHSPHLQNSSWYSSAKLTLQRDSICN